MRGRKPLRTLNLSTLLHSIKTCNSMSESCRYLGVSYNTFKKYCKIYGLWTEENINQGGKGLSKPRVVYSIQYDETKDECTE